jgi:hypothetical protein
MASVLDSGLSLNFNALLVNVQWMKINAGPPEIFGGPCYPICALDIKILLVRCPVDFI